MKYIVLPIDDAKLIFTEEELSTMRKSTDETEVIVHEEILLNKREAMGMSVLPTDDNGEIQWTYPIYGYNTDELNSLLESDKWTNKEEEMTEESSINTKAASIEIIDFIPPMRIEDGKYYREDGIVYKCIQTSRLSVSNALKDLVGYYVEIVK